MVNPNTEITTPAEIAILPDWLEGIQHSVEFASAVQRSWSGRDQRQRKRERATRTIRYMRSGLTAAQARQRRTAIREESRQPIYAPWWPDGIPIAVMSNQTTITLDIAPIEGEWDGLAKVYIWNKASGGQFRTISTLSGRTLTLSGTGTIYPAGAWVFPCPIAIRIPDEQQLEPVNIESGTESIAYRTL